MKLPPVAEWCTHPVFAIMTETKKVYDDSPADVETLLHDGLDKYDEAFIRHSHLMLPRYQFALHWMLENVRLNHTEKYKNGIYDEMERILKGTI